MGPDAEALRDDELFGTLAVKKMFITEEEAKAAIRKQKGLLAKGTWKRLGAILIEEKLLAPEQVKEAYERRK